MDVLIIEDNKNCRESLKSFFEDRKMRVYFGHEANHGELLLSVKQFDLVVIDLLLPKVNGLEFLKKVQERKLMSSRATVWYASGVIKENALSRRFLRQAAFFVQKPYMQEKMDQNLYQIIHSSDSRITKIFYYFYMNPNSHVNFVFKSKEQIEAHQVMFVCMRVCQSNEKGVITITPSSTNPQSEKQKITYSITFNSGRIVSLNTNNRNLALDSLLVSQKIIDPEKLKQVKETLKPGESLENKLLTLKLVNQSDFENILQLRLQKFFSIVTREKQKLDIEWKPLKQRSHVKPGCVSYGTEDLVNFMQSWIKDIETKWLQAFFLRYKEYILHFVKDVSIIQSDNTLIKYLRQKTEEGSSRKLSKYLIQLGESNITMKLKMLYCRFLLGECFFSRDDYVGDSSVYYKEQKIKLDEFLEQKKNKKRQEIFNLSPKSKFEDVEMLYKQIVKILHPDLIDKDAPKNYRISKNNLLNFFNNAYNEIVQQKKADSRTITDYGVKRKAINSDKDVA